MHREGSDSTKHDRMGEHPIPRGPHEGMDRGGGFEKNLKSFGEDFKNSGLLAWGHGVED